MNHVTVVRIVKPIIVCSIRPKYVRGIGSNGANYAGQRSTQLEMVVYSLGLEAFKLPQQKKQAKSRARSIELA